MKDSQSYDTVFALNKPMHLKITAQTNCLCGRYPPGFYSGSYDIIVNEDGVLTDTEYNWPCNVDDFCKQCLKKVTFDAAKTEAAYYDMFVKPTQKRPATQ